jgi:hypothetical protein
MHNTGISCRASTLAPRAVSFIPLFDGRFDFVNVSLS